ncbi:uncharacterized protein METZ01_LOCUS378031, partial [marine metagenome]
VLLCAAAGVGSAPSTTITAAVITSSRRICLSLHTDTSYCTAHAFGVETTAVPRYPKRPCRLSVSSLEELRNCVLGRSHVHLDHRDQESIDMPTKLAKISPLALIALGLLFANGLQGFGAQQSSNDSHARLPRFEVDLSWQWPPKLPNNWVVGVVTWVAVDQRDHVWVLHRPRQVPIEIQDRAAPPVLEFDTTGRFVQAWGGPGEGYDWGDMEHSLSVDYQDNVWITFHNP